MAITRVWGLPGAGMTYSRAASPLRMPPPSERASELTHGALVIAALINGIAAARVRPGCSCGAQRQVVGMGVVHGARPAQDACGKRSAQAAAQRPLIY